MQALAPRVVDGRNSSRTDISFPAIGLGTAGIRGLTASVTRAAVNDFGYTLIDTAQANEWYDEAGIGDALASDDAVDLNNVVIVTKVHPRSYR